MFDYIFTTASTTTSLTLFDVIITIGIAFITGTIISITYMRTQKNFSQNFALTVILLPAVICIIIMLIGSDIARAFSLAGAFSIIRFRSAPGDPKDIAYVLFSMAAGLASGAGALSYAIIFTIILCGVMILLDKISFGSKQAYNKSIQVTVPEDLDYDSYINEVLDKHTKRHQLNHIKTTALGSLYVLSYDITLKDGHQTKAFIDDIRCINGNLNIKLMTKSDNYAV